MDPMNNPFSDLPGLYWSWIKDSTEAGLIGGVFNSTYLHLSRQGSYPDCEFANSVREKV